MSKYSSFIFYGSWREMLNGFEKSLGEEYAAKETSSNKKEQKIQDAHEAIRPT